MQVKKQELELDMEKEPSSKSGKEYIKAVYCHPAYLTYMQGTLCEMLGWMKHKLESRLPGERSITSDTEMTPPLWQKAKEFQKTIYVCFMDYTRAFDCVDHNKVWKILRDGNTRPPYLSPEKPVCGSRSNS